MVEEVKTWANDSYMTSLSDWRRKFFHSPDGQVLLIIRKKVLYVLEKEDRKCP